MTYYVLNGVVVPVEQADTDVARNMLKDVNK